MAGTAATHGLTDRMLRAARLDRGLYHEVEADITATATDTPTPTAAATATSTDTPTSTSTSTPTPTSTPIAGPKQPDCSTGAHNLVGDCGFESPDLGTTANQTFGSGVGPWFGGSGGSEIDNNAANGEWDPNSGKRSADLNPSGPSSLFQDISTQPGHVYSVTFPVAGNPITNPFACAFSQP